MPSKGDPQNLGKTSTNHSFRNDYGRNFLCFHTSLSQILELVSSAAETENTLQSKTV